MAKKNHIQASIDSQIVYFSNGSLTNVFPNDEVDWCRSRYLFSDDVLYDLTSVDDVRKIVIPDFSKHNTAFKGYGVTGSLDYFIRKRAGLLTNPETRELCSAHLWKAAELMFANERMGWQPSDFDRIVNWHNGLAMFEEAKKAQQYLNQHETYTQNQSDRYAKMARNAIFRKAKQFNDDLVSITAIGGGCCEKCAPFQKRVYSISGKNKTFPQLPNYVKEHGNLHPGCQCMISPFSRTETKLFVNGFYIDAIATSLRPWVDDRTEEERKTFERLTDAKKKKEDERRSTAEYYIYKGLRLQEKEKTR